MRHTSSMSIASDAIRHPISVHSAGILFPHDHCPFGRIICDIFLCLLRRMLSDIPSPSIPPEFYSGMIIVHSVAYMRHFSMSIASDAIRHPISVHFQRLYHGPFFRFFPFSSPQICIYQNFFVPLHPNSKISCSGSKPVCIRFQKQIVPMKHI